MSVRIFVAADYTISAHTSVWIWISI